MEDYKVSVIVAAYNIQDYIVKCLESIANQTYKNLEVIVVDDGSSDNTGKLADEFAKNDNRFIVIHKANGGVSSARNRGIDVASGDFIGFVDGDDTIENDMYEMLVNNAIKYKADISHCGYKVIENNKETFFYNTKQIIIQDRKKGLLDLFEGTLIEPSLCNKIFRKNIVGNIRLDESIKINEDLYFNVLLFNKSNISIFEDNTKYNYIKRYNSASNSNKNNIKRITDPRKIYKLIIEIFKDDVDILPYAQRMDLGRNINIYNLLILERDNVFLQLKNEVRDYIKLNYKNIKDNKLINKKIKYMMFGILYLPHIYTLIYKFYFNKKYMN
ncbi:glycosyltransferase family 2 protein [Intestinibacter bartlettii]|uniref:glycosyltransferase family 2 protein n=1 Tax=Intestinibacter bartlettii TaxID=261299 RepID=UPI00248C9345|nr:glycosyltransferase [Intestinibacter bartlettii]